MADFVYNDFRLNLVSTSTVATVGVGTSSQFHYEMMAVTTGYLDQSSREDQKFVRDPTASSASLQAFELSTGTGYSRQLLAINTKTLSDALNEIHLTGTTRVSWAAVTSSGGAIGGVAIFQQIAASDSSGRRPISFFDSGFPITPNGGTINVDQSTKGWAVVASTS